MNNADYLLSADDWVVLTKIKQRLYAEQQLTGDERRDLANKLDAIMHLAIPYITD